MKPHECHEDNSCCCSMQALEPDEECPVHGFGEWPPRCGICGRFIKRTYEQLSPTSTISDNKAL